MKTTTETKKQLSTITTDDLTSVKGGVAAKTGSGITGNTSVVGALLHGDPELAAMLWLGAPGHPIGNAIGNAINGFLTKTIGS
jgi:hypothetical protein